MYPNQYDLHEQRKELLRQAAQHRLVREARPLSSTSLAQRTGQNLIKWGTRLAVRDTEECVIVETSGQTVTVCPA